MTNNFLIKRFRHAQSHQNDKQFFNLLRVSKQPFKNKNAKSIIK